MENNCFYPYFANKNQDMKEAKIGQMQFIQ